MIDIYFEPNYGKLYEDIEKGKSVFWKYSGEEGCILHQFILREIPIKINGEAWYDIVTPYGYGGPIIEYVLPAYSREELILSFKKSFENYCFENKIVSEFIRFHPIFKNADDFKSIYDVSFNRLTLGTNLIDFENPVVSEFSKSCRKTIKSVIKSGVAYRVTKSPDSLDEFQRIYYLNMERKNADEYYFFNKKYFSNILSTLRDNILLVEAVYNEKTIAAGLYFIYNNLIHAHLSGTDSDYLYLSPAYILKYGTVIWAKENGYRLIHYGGGVSSDKEDSLFKFKKKFSQNTEFPFYIGKKIWNKKIYDLLCKENKADVDSGFFPSYRKR